MARYNSYSKEQEDFLMENAIGISRKELTERFNNQFKVNKSVLAIKTWCNNRKIYNGIDTKIQKGDKPWNLGVKGQDYFNHRDRQEMSEHLKKVHERNKTAIIGEEKIINGVPYIRVAVGRGISKYDRWRRKRYIVWEQHYGEIPKGNCILSLDGDNMNLDITNLVCIPRKYMAILMKNGWFSENKIIRQSAIKWCELHFSIKSQ